MSHTDHTFEPMPLSLTGIDKALLKALADKRFEGNKSMAARFMIRHFALCQFPLIGIDLPRPVPGSGSGGVCAPAGVAA